VKQELFLSPLAGPLHHTFSQSAVKNNIVACRLGLSASISQLFKPFSPVLRFVVRQILATV
jgi:hypothetical protein